jgi:hypothetical protein
VNKGGCLPDARSDLLHGHVNPLASFSISSYRYFKHVEVVPRTCKTNNAAQANVARQQPVLVQIPQEVRVRYFGRLESCFSTATSSA